MRTFAVTDPTTEEASEAMLSIFAEATFLADAAEALASLENDAAGVAIDSLINDEAEGTTALQMEQFHKVSHETRVCMSWKQEWTYLRP